MKILVSTKSLANALSRFDFENDRIVRVNAQDSHLYLLSETRSVQLWCEITQFQASVKQEGTRWDWVRDLMEVVDEQPVALDISEKAVQIMFSY